MSAFVLTLVLVSALTHAGWNLLARGQGARSMSFFYRKLVVTVVAGALPALAADVLLGPLPGKALLLAAGSGLFCGGYYFALARGYSLADFAFVYPLVRGLPVVLVGLGDAAFGRFPTGPGWLGLFLVVGGCFLAPQRSLGGWKLRAYLHGALAWVVLAACGTVGYTLFDKQAATVVTRGPATAARYGFYFFLFTLVWFAVIQRVWLLLGRRFEVYGGRTGGEDVPELEARGLRESRARESRAPHEPAGTQEAAGKVAQQPAAGWRVAAAGAVLDALSYWLILWAFQLALRASYVIAFRQASIIVGVAAAFLVFREGGRLPRGAAAVLITAGLVVIALWGG